MFFSRETRWVPRGEQEVPALPVIFVGLELGSFYSICSFLCDILSTIMFFSWSLHRLSAFFFTIAPSVRLFFGHCIVCPPLLAIASSVRLCWPLHRLSAFRWPLHRLSVFCWPLHRLSAFCWPLHRLSAFWLSLHRLSAFSLPLLTITSLISSSFSSRCHCTYFV